MLTSAELHEAFRYYGLDDRYFLKCQTALANAEAHAEAYETAFHHVYTTDLTALAADWKITDPGDYFYRGADPFLPNLTLLEGYRLAEKTMTAFHLPEELKKCQKARIRECFLSDLEGRGKKGIRLSQMLWGIYLTRVRLIEVGRLQFENRKNDGGRPIVRIHIPRGGRFDRESVLSSIHEAKGYLRDIYGLEDPIFSCESWLLSRKLRTLLPDESHIAQFSDLFDIHDDENAKDDILDFLFGVDPDTDLLSLPEKTSLQKTVKEALLSGEVFLLGEGRLKKEFD